MYIIKNWLTWSWSLRSPKMGSWQSEDPANAAAGRVRRTEDQKSWWYKFPCETQQDQEPTFQLGLKEKTKVLGLAARLEEFCLKLLVLFQSLINWIRPTHIRKDSLPIQMLMSSRNTLTDNTSGIMLDLMSGHPAAQLNWHIQWTIILTKSQKIQKKSCPSIWFQMHGL